MGGSPQLIPGATRAAPRRLGGFDLANFGHFGIILKPGEDLGSLAIQPEGGGDDLFSGRFIGETEKNLGGRPGGVGRLPGGGR